MSCIDRLLEVEDRYSLYEKQIEGVYCWTLTRSSMQYSVIGKASGNSRSPHENEKKLKYKINALKCVISSLWSLLLIKKERNKEVVFLVSRRIWDNGRFVSYCTEDLKAWKTNSVLLEQSNSTQNQECVNEDGQMYIDALVQYNLVYLKLYRSFCRRKVEKLRKKTSIELSAPLGEILGYYNSDKTVEKAVDDIVDHILLFNISKKTFSRILTVFNPRVIIEVCHYSFINMVFNSIAHDLGIPVVELQHGTMHEDHIAYQYSKDVKVPLLPDYIFTFSDYWNKVANVPRTSTKLISTGFPYFEKGVQKAKEENVRRDNRTTILFLSPGLETHLGQIAIDIANACDSKSYRIIYKLHPFEYNMKDSALEHLIRDDIELIRGSEPGLYDLFAQSDIQISTFSTAIYEGLGFGLKTFIYKEGWAQTMQSFVDEGYGKFFETSEELKMLIADGGKEENKTSTMFWKTDAANCMKREIAKILEQE